MNSPDLRECAVKFDAVAARFRKIFARHWTRRQIKLNFVCLYGLKDFGEPFDFKTLRRFENHRLNREKSVKFAAQFKNAGDYGFERNSFVRMIGAPQTSV